MTNDTPGLIADLGVFGVCQAQKMALLDMHVVDTDNPSYEEGPVQLG